jgi:antitoxin CptB
MLTDIEYKKLVWHSRRGMRELDLLLLPFVEQVLPQLQEEQQWHYRQLLEEEDQDLFSWLVQREPVPDARLQNLVDLIRARTHVHSN